MKTRGYIKDFEVHDPHRVGRITVQLQGRVNDCKALTYRQDLKARDIEAYKTRALPTRQWGYVVSTTPNGVLDHEEAMRQNVQLEFFYCCWSGLNKVAYTTKIPHVSDNEISSDFRSYETNNLVYM
ncbi:hypothetical protein QQ045_026763 [Rhodiola kirilowii]